MANNLKYWATVVAGVGALNWGLDAFGFNIVTQFLADYATYIYYAFGAAGAYLLFNLFGRGGG